MHYETQLIIPSFAHNTHSLTHSLSQSQPFCIYLRMQSRSPQRPRPKQRFRKHQTPLANEIIARLVLANYEGAHDATIHERFGVTHIVSALEADRMQCAHSDDQFVAAFTRQHVALADTKHQDILSALDGICDSIQSWLAADQQHVVLVHWYVSGSTWLLIGCTTERNMLIDSSTADRVSAEVQRSSLQP
jgi:hypothetical protein